MIDYSRHEDVFHPVTWGGRRVDVIGLGATGSKVALSLAKLGVQNLHLWDGDTVEPHNIANQVYRLGDLESRKTDALAALIRDATGTEPKLHGWWSPEEVRNVGDVVFLMVDSMRTRKEFFTAQRMNGRISLVIDPRLGASHGHVLTYRPAVRDTLQPYEGQLYDDEDAITETSACGTAITVGPTADIVAGYCVWAFMREASGVHPEHEIAVMAREPGLVEV